MTMRMLNINATFRKLSVQLSSENKKGFKKEVNSFVRDLRDETPVDTGRARDSWEIVYNLNENKASVESDVPYMPRLNEGHSQQAPSNFIELTALRHGKPLGPIVKIDEP
jgi:hypothetical protein